MKTHNMMIQNKKLLIGISIIGGLILLVLGGWWAWKNQLSAPVQPSRSGTVIPDEKYCEKNSDCVFLDFECCPSPNPCKNEPAEVINKESRENIEQDMKAKCPVTCPQYAPPLCFDCLNLEKFSPVCVSNQCLAKRELNCEEYCKAVTKDKSKPCPWISNEDLITQENTKKCQCKEEAEETKCNEKCILLGYSLGTCRAMGSESEPELGCKSNETNIGETSDCQFIVPQREGIMGLRKACCCKK